VGPVGETIERACKYSKRSEFQMKISNFIVFVSALLVVAFPSALWAQQYVEDVPLTVSRDSDGKINKHSKEAIKYLSKMAVQNGYVRVWVTLDFPFDPFLAEDSEIAADAQQARLDKVFDEVLNPLLRSELVSYSNGSQDYVGPSLLLKATKKGLSGLVNDQRVGQLVGVRE